MVKLKHLLRVSTNIVKVITLKLPTIASIAEKEDGALKIVARLRRAYDLLTHVKRHRKVVAALNQPNIRKGFNGQAHLAVKYLHPRYLVRGIATDDKAKIVLHHYEFLQKNFTLPFIEKLTGRGAILWEHEEVQTVHTIVMRYAHPIDNEGEIILEYRFNHVVAFVASFAFAPGTIAGLPDRTVVLITRIQGVRESYEQIGFAMKSLRGLSGAAVLFAAMQGIAVSLDIRTVLGPVAEAQACYSDRFHSTFVSMYDDFFNHLNGRRITASLYSIALPIIEKPLSEVKANNRSKVKAQRDYKRSIAGDVCSVLRCHRPLQEPQESSVRNIAA